MNKMLIDKFKDFTEEFESDSQKLEYLKSISLDSIIELEERELEKLKEGNNKLI